MFRNKTSLALMALGFSCLVPISTAYSAKKIEIDDTRWISIGAGIRVAATATEDGAPNGTDYSKDFDVQNIRLYLSGQITEWMKFTFNTDEIFSDGPVDVLDAFAQFELDEAFNIWVGRMLTPADRIEMNGPFYGLTWNQYTQPLYPSDQGGAAGTYGRDDGVTVWGDFGNFQYAFGVFDGLEGGANTDDSFLYAGRVAYNFLNKEENPGYYTSSTYYGSLGEIFTVGASVQSQKNGSGNALNRGDFFGYAIDVFYEQPFENGGVLNIEGEYKNFDSDFTVGSPAPGGGCFCLFDGDSYYVTAAYLFPEEIGPGKFQPYARYVKNSPNDAASSDLIEVGMNYVIKGHDLRLNFNYSNGDANITGYPGPDRNTFSIGVQFQI